MLRTIGRSLLAACAVAASLTGCSAGPLAQKLEDMPESLGGLPPDTPKAPAMPYQYPAVHDMPPPRSDQPLSEDQQWRLEKELSAARDRQENAEAKENGKDKKDAPLKKKTAKKPPAPTQASQNTSAKTNP
jgi:hypothetical protein